MYCEKCGSELPSTALFCPNCGTAVESAPHPDSADAAEAEVPRSFNFEKRKGFSYLTYKTIDTNVVLHNNWIGIAANTCFLGWQSFKQSAIPLKDIVSVSVRRTWDFWDLAFAVFILVMTQMRHWSWLLLVLLFVYSAAGHCIEIRLRNGKKQVIPYSSLAPDNDFATQLQQRINGLGNRLY